MEFREYIKQQPQTSLPPPRTKKKNCLPGDASRDLFIPKRWRSPTTFDLGQVFNIPKTFTSRIAKAKRWTSIFQTHVQQKLSFFIFSTFILGKKDWGTGDFFLFFWSLPFFPSFFFGFGAWMHVERHEDTNSVVALHRSYHLLAFQEDAGKPRVGKLAVSDKIQEGISELKKSVL